MTIQKIIPLIILRNLIIINDIKLIKFNVIILLFISILCSFFGILIIKLKILLSYSSIIQITWVIILIYINEIYIIIFFFIYSFISLILIIILKKFNLIFLNDLNLLKFQYNWIYIFYFFIWISLARLPPFFGFLIKWISIQIINLNFNFLLILLLIFNSLISIFFYLRISFYRFLRITNSLKLNFLILNYLIKFEFKLIYLNWLLIFILLFYELV